MPTFYWVGNGCPKDGTSSTSHLWGISEYSWNNPSNWIVAHSLHEVPVGSGTANVFRKKVEVYAVPNRVPGPGDTVYVGHYPWLTYDTYANLSSVSSSYTLKVNDLLFDAMAWSTPSGSQVKAPRIARNPSSALPVLWKQYDTNGKVITVSVPSGVAGTSAKPINRKFYATTSSTLSGVTNYSAYSEWFDGTVSTSSTVLTEAAKIYGYVSGMMSHRSQYMLGKVNWTAWNNSGGLMALPNTALAPLLWGGCVAGSTGTTSASGISGGSGFTYWPNASTSISNPNLLAATGQAVDEFNIVLYSDNLRTSNGSFMDPYPFNSVGDGLFGEEYENVKNNITKPYCGSTTGGAAFYGEDCYSCAAGATARSLNYNSIWINKSVTGEGARANTLFVKANKVNVKTPHEWNKYGGNNPLGGMIWHEDMQPAYRYNTGDSTSWISKQMGLIDCAGETGCAERFGEYGNAGSKDSLKYVELRLADNYGSLTSANDNFMGTVVHAQMRYGQFNMTYGRVQELHMGIPHGSYGNEYSDGNMQIANINNIFASVSPTEVATSLPYYQSSNTSALSLYNNTNFVNGENITAKFGKANPFWPSQGVYFMGGQSNGDLTSRVNVLNSYSVSATVFPKTFVGVSRIFLGYNDNFEFSGQSLTAPASTYNYTKDYGSIFVNHGYPLVVPNRNPQYQSLGVFQYGSMLTGDTYRANLISASSVGLVNGSIGSTGISGGIISTVDTTRPKSAFVTSILNSQVGDMVLENTDYLFLSPENMSMTSIEKYGNKTIDRMFVKDNTSIDISDDTHGYLHFGRILNANTGYTGSIYGGIIFQGDNNEIFKPAAGTRLWVSALAGNSTDNRQQTMPVQFVAANNSPGSGEQPSSLATNSSTVNATSKQNPYSYVLSEIISLKNPDVSINYNQVGDVNEIPGQAL